MEPNTRDISQRSVHDAVIVKFGLDTTDLSEQKEICQISAICNDNVFNEYILPDKDISHFSENINKLAVKLIRNERKLFHNGTQVDALSQREGLIEFLNFLGVQSDGKVLLAAHNCFTFDGCIIIREMKKHDMMDTFESHVLGFIDTIPVFKSALPTRVQEKRSFSLPELAKDYELDEGSFLEGRHAGANVKMLDLLITKIGCTDDIIKQHAKYLDVFVQSMPENVKARVAGLAPLTNAISPTMKNNIAKAGISMEILKKVYDENGTDGVSMILQEDIGGKPRVTKSQKIIQSINTALSELFPADSENAAAN